MKGDFSRQTFDRSKHYRGVVMQQGRVQLDADWNENLAIGSHLLQTLTRDVVGECGVPVHVNAFKIGAPSPIDPARPDFTISAGPQGKGRMYVGGLLIEIEEDATYLKQPDWPGPPDGTTLDGLGPVLPELGDGKTRVDLVYVDVWPRAISAIEDPHIREVALGGPDTAERVRLIWQVKVKPDAGPDANCNTPLGLPALGGGTARLIVAAPPVPPDPCEPTAQGGYQGPDNRFYRIEVHQSGPLGQATFKWSRDNGSVVASIEQFKTATELVVRSLGRDDTLRLKKGDLVEIADDATELSGLPGTLAKITQIDEASRTVTLDTAIPDAVRQAAGRHPKARRWEGVDAITAAPVELEAGLKVEFAGTGTGGADDDFRTGDYWTFAARVIDGSIDPDSLTQAPARPMGVHHAFCTLAVIKWTREGDSVRAQVQDCRLVFPPLTEIEGEDCCTVTVGDGGKSRGQFTDIQAAIDSLEKGGRVCLLPGDYRVDAPIEVRDRADLVISGCGAGARIIAFGDNPAIAIVDSTRIKLESLTVLGRSPQGVVAIEGGRVIEVSDSQIGNSLTVGQNGDTLVSLDGRPGGPAILASNSLLVTIKNNDLFGLPALSLQAELGKVVDNRLSGGGAWVCDGSSRIEIHANDIANGRGAGIVLGGLGPNEEPGGRVAGVDGVQITDNTISFMGGSGVTTMRPAGNTANRLGIVSDLDIADNRIAACVSRPDEAVTDEVTLGGIVLREAAGVRIHHNTIVENGAAAQAAANGIFVLFCEELAVSDNRIADNGTSLAAAIGKCVDFTAEQPNEGDNPRREGGATFTVFDQQGQRTPHTQVFAGAGLECGFKTEIVLDATTSAVELTVRSDGGATVTALDETGARVDAADLSQSSTPQVVTLNGARIRSITIVAPNGKVFLQKLCTDVGAVGFQAGIAAINVVGRNSTGAARRTGGNAPAAIIHDNTVLCPQGHTLIAIGLGALSIADNVLSSQGVRAQPALPALPILTEAQAKVINQVLRQTSNVFILDVGQARDAPAGVNTPVRTHFSTNATAANFRAAAVTQLPDGRVAFDANQVTMQDFHTPVARAGSFAVFILSPDDLSFQHNQINTEIPQASALTSAFVSGGTIRATGNRITELPHTATTSCRTSGARLNITRENQTTHCIAAVSPKLIFADNQQLFCDTVG